MVHDLLIIGAGPAGLAVALYAARAGLKTMLVGRPQDSGLFSAHNVQNYPGFPDGIAGPELLNLFLEQARKHGAEIDTEKEVVSVKAKEGLTPSAFAKASADTRGGSDPPPADFLITLDSGEEYAAKRILIASGRVPALSGIKGERELKGKGVHYCVACDGPLYKGKKVAVVGSKDFAFQEAKELLSYTNDITIISHAPAFEGRAERKTELEKAGAKFIVGHVKEFVAIVGGSDPPRGGRPSLAVQSLILDSNEEQSYDVVFMALGSASALSFAQALGIEIENDRVKVDRETGRTNVAGVYAAGCAGEDGYGQIVKSAGEGATAAIAIIKDLKGLKGYVDHT